MTSKSFQMKKVFALLLSLSMVFALLPSVALAASTDISGHWAENTLIKWSDMGWFNGDGKGSYRPNDSTTRAEFITMVNRIYGFNGESADIGNYTDVSPASWYYSQISAALAAGYVSGTGANTMSPEKIITRQEAMTIIANIEGISSDNSKILSLPADGDQVAGWAKAKVAACMEEGYVSGSNGKIYPTANITRAESVVLLDKLYSDIRTFAFAGTYGPEEGMREIGEVYIEGSGVRLQNMSVSGNLTVSKNVGEGEAYLNNIDVGGDLHVQGGGGNSVYIAHVRVKGNVIVFKTTGQNKVRIIASGDCDFQDLLLRSGATLEMKELKNGSIGRITIDADYLAGSSFDFIGDFLEIINNASNAQVTLEGNVDHLKLNASANIKGNGKIKNADVSDAASGSTFAVAPESVTGNGKDKINLPGSNNGNGNNGSNNSGNSGSTGDNGNGNTTVVVNDFPALSYTVAKNAAFNLPATVSAGLAGGSTKEFAVSWNPATASTATLGTFTFEGTLTMVEGYRNPSGKKVTLTLTVVDSVNTLATAKDALTFNVIKGQNGNEQNIVKNLTLPSSLSGYPNVTIRWSSDNKSVISDSGIVTRPGSSGSKAQVTLTATLTLNGESVIKTFTLTVNKKDAADTGTANADTRYAAGYPSISADGNGKVTVSVKLKPGVATEQNPVICYFAIAGLNARYYTFDRESILYGHMVSSENGSIANADYVDEHVITGDGVFTFTTDQGLAKDSSKVEAGLVLLANGNTGDPLSAAKILTLTDRSAGNKDSSPPVSQAGAQQISAFINPSQGTMMLEISPSLAFDGGWVATLNRTVSLKQKGVAVSGLKYSAASWDANSCQVYFTFSKISGASAVGDFTFSIASGLKNTAQESVTASNKSFDTLLADVSASGATAGYGSDKINIALPAGITLDTRSYAACGFVLKIDGQRVLYRGYIHRDAANANVLVLELNNRTSNLIQNAQSVTIEYAPNAAGHDMKPYDFLSDCSGALISAFPEITVNK